jgi:hypothetical protein
VKKPKKILVAKGYESVVASGHPKVTNIEYAWAVVIKDVFPKERIDFERSLGFTCPYAPDTVQYDFYCSKSLKNARQRLDVIRAEEYKKDNTKEQHERLRKARAQRWTTGEVVELIELEGAEIPVSKKPKKNPKWFETPEGKVRLFSQDDLNTPEQHNINTLILEQASDIAEELTELECQKAGIPCWTGDEQSKAFTEEAQSIFEVHYDKQVTSLYNLLNAQIKEISTAKTQTKYEK